MVYRTTEILHTRLLLTKCVAIFFNTKRVLLLILFHYSDKDLVWVLGCFKNGFECLPTALTVLFRTEVINQSVRKFHERIIHTMFDSFGLSELSYLDTKQWTQKWNRRLRQPVERQAWLPGQFWREDRGLPISHEECPWLFKSTTILDCSRITLSNEDSGIASSLSCEAMNTIARSFRLIGRGFARISISAITI